MFTSRRTSVPDYWKCLDESNYLSLAPFQYNSFYKFIKASAWCKSFVVYWCLRFKNNFLPFPDNCPQIASHSGKTKQNEIATEI